jgi:hypothetical protein
MTSKFKQIIIRIRYIDYKYIQKIFPAKRNESAAKYFQRLRYYLINLRSVYI